MIFYFSGTGNSRWIAFQLAEALQDRLVFIPEAMQYSSAIPKAITVANEGENSSNARTPEYTLAEGEKVGFVFPVYSWGPPQIVLDFIKSLTLSGYKDHYTYFVCSCGDETGFTPDRMRKALTSRRWSCHAGFSVCMPNNYILFPGFDVDPPDVEKRKLSEAVPRMQEIISQICNKAEVEDCHIGSLPWLKSRIIFPLFNRFAVSARPYDYTEACNGCRKCERHCPTRNITLSDDRRPVWGNRCTMCVACYHICPQHAVTYSNKTRGKGTYFHPEARQTIR